MSEVWWKSFLRGQGGKPKNVPTSERDPLPVALTGNSLSPVTQVATPTIITAGRLYHVLPFEIPGIVAADAFDALDMFGAVFSLAVPKAGAIVKALFHDLDDEGLVKNLWIFRQDPAAMPASDAAFSLTDAQNLIVSDVLQFGLFRDGINNQIGYTTELPCWYVAPNGFLWFAVQTPSADNIAAGSMPRLSLTIERYSDD
jgi:hypothetical protein